MNNSNFKSKALLLLTDASILNKKGLFTDLITRVSPERRVRIDECRSQEDKYLSLAGGLLLDLLLKRRGLDASIIHDCDNKPIVVAKEDSDVVLSGVYVSLTHCWPYAVALIADSPCGVDIERRDLDLEAIYRRYYTSSEKEYCHNDQELMSDVWCRKECYIKFDKVQDLRNIDTSIIPENYAYHSVALSGYSFELLIRGDEFLLETVELDSFERDF